MAIYTNSTAAPQLIYDYIRKAIVVQPGESVQYISDTEAVAQGIVNAALVQSGRQSIANGASSVSISFTTAFPSDYSPSVTITIQGTPNVFAALTSVNNTGFVAALSVSVGNANYILNWSAN